MAEKFAEGDSVALQGEIAHVHDNGTVTIRVHGFDYPLTIRSEHVSLVAKTRTPKRSRPLFDEH